MGQVLGIVYRCIATHLIKKAGLSRKTAQAGAVTWIQRFGSALNLIVTITCCSSTGRLSALYSPFLLVLKFVFRPFSEALVAGWERPILVWSKNSSALIYQHLNI